VDSILQLDKRCWLCGRTGPEHLDRHHVYAGAMRNQSEKYGLTVWLCHDSCHERGTYAVHNNRATREELQAWAQKRAMDYYGWSMADWMSRFYKSYI
jgi:hypothetical protein